MRLAFSRYPLLVLGLLAAACGGSAGGGAPTTPSSSAPPGPTAVCAAALAASGPMASAAAYAPDKRPGPLGWDVRDPRELLWMHRVAGAGGARAQGTVRSDRDEGNIAVVDDDGSLIVAANRFDLRGLGLRFRQNASGGYDVSQVAASFRSRLGERLRLADDDTSQRTFPFAFPFYGRRHTSAFVNSDGNVTFDQGDTAIDERGLGRFLSGVPRVAPFFADLDPSSGGGIFVDAASDALTVTWCSVRGFESSSTVTAQASLFPDGTVELKFGEPTTLAAAVVGISPGGGDSLAFTPVDLSAPATAGGPGALGERFATEASLDTVGVARRFLSRHSDTYDQIVIWTDTRVTGSDAFAFESTVSNDIRGIGVPIFDDSSSYGSGGRLASVVVMDDLGKYPDNPATRIPRFPVDNTLSILGQESGHRWGAYLRFRDASGRPSNLLLGRDDAHWSFFFDSDASVLEGNDIEDLGGGSFRTVAAVQRYGPLDLYAMGLLEESEVPPVFFVDNPANTSETRESDPRIGVTFTGTRREVRIEDIVAAMGSRQPPANQSPRRHTQAFVYVVGRGRTASPAALEKLERIRAAWESFFAAATEGRMTADTGLR